MLLPIYPSLHEEEGGWSNMKRAPTDKPNLDDILARDFSELKVGEANLAREEVSKADDTEPVKASVPKVYNQRIDAVEERTSFAVKPPSATDANQESKPPSPPQPHVLKAPSAQPGDDFDVDW